MAWMVTGTQVPDGDDLALWIDDTGRVTDVPLPNAEPLPGRYVAYGLVDAHAHPFVGEEEQIAEGGISVHTEQQALAVLAGYASGGVTAVRDVGSPMGVALDLAVPTGLPRVDAAGRFLGNAERYPRELVVETVAPEDLVAAGLAEVRRGARWIKVVSDDVSSGIREPAYDAATIRALVEAAHAAGARVAVHCMTDFVGELVHTGLDSVEHGVVMDDDAIAVMAANDIAWTPTLSPYAGEFQLLPEHVRPKIAEMQRNVREMLPRAHAAGVRILAGTDVSGPLHGEVAFLASYGLSPVDALRAATTNAYEFLRIEGSGLGERLNVVTYDDDPREDPAVLARPAAVLIDGVRVT